VSEPYPSVTVVLVSWEPGPELVRCVSSLAAARKILGATGPPVSLVVVDNGGGSFPRASITEAWPDAVIVANEENRGFGPAANQGAAQASAEVLLFLNPDTEVDGEPFSPLSRGFAEHPEAVALAPRLVEAPSPGQESQAAFQLRRLPSRRQAIRELLLVDKAFPGNRGLARDRYAEDDREQPFPVEQPAAAALAIRRAAFEAVGGFDPAFAPAWFEDVDLCARLARLGGILYWPASRFVHLGGTAARRLGYAAFLPIYFRNAYRFWRKHHALADAFGYRALLAVGMVLRLLVLPFRRSVPRPRREAATAYARVLRGAIGLDRTFRIPREVRREWRAAPCREARMQGTWRSDGKA
jgi:N-acetylglucosaminyl-diphospho-decaprenol L-rhamnosyltransferase